MVGETVDLILVKEDGVEITFFSFYLFNIAMLLLSTHHDIIHIKYICFLFLCYAFFQGKFGFDLKTR